VCASEVLLLVFGIGVAVDMWSKTNVEGGLGEEESNAFKVY